MDDVTKYNEILAQLTDFLDAHRQLFVLTGAGISTASGIPDYRDSRGDWKHARPIEYREFVESHPARQRYWARSTLGWRRFNAAQPSTAHYRLAELERAQRLTITVTQNVDRLHQRAGSSGVIDLHGRNDRIVCISCKRGFPRRELQAEMLRRNPLLADVQAEPAPDGDALINTLDFSAIDIPDCVHCGGVLKPDVVFFGENVPGERVEKSLQALFRSDAVLVLGSSLMVYSGFRFVRRAHGAGIPVAAVNLGKTRADDLLDLKIEAGCDEVLETVTQQLNCRVR